MNAPVDAATSDFDLLETLLLEDGRYTLLERHLQRLQDSAAYFDFTFPAKDIDVALSSAARDLNEGRFRIRLLVSRDGVVCVEHFALGEPPALPLRCALARTPVDSSDPFLYHKTTHRAVYEAHKSPRPDVFDVLLWNEWGELTEFTIGNLVIDMDGRRWTPPVACGLLAGTMRAELLERGEIAERILTKDDLAAASRVWFINSVRGWLPVAMVP